MGFREAQRQQKGLTESEEAGTFWRSTILEISSRLRVAQGIGKTETEASTKALAKLKALGQCDPPPFVSDGWGGIREAIIEVYGEVPPYQGRGRPPSNKRALPHWQYLQIVKQRDRKGRLQRVVPRAIFGDEQELLAVFGAHTAYIERSHLTMRQDNCRLARKSLSFSKARRQHEAAIIWEDAAYNLVKPLKSLRLEVNPQAARFERRYHQRTPAMAAGVSDHAWSYDELLRTVTVPSPSDT